MKRVLITGCSSGIGRMLVRSFLEDGWLVIATLRHASDRQNLFDDEQTRFPGQLVVKSLDVTSDAERQDVTSYIGSGGLDCLVNNAGFALFGALENCSEAQIQSQCNAIQCNSYDCH